MIPDFEKDGIKLYNGDCMDLMRQTPDNFYDLAIVDPPYGIGFSKFNRTNTDEAGNRYKADKYKNSEWDNSIPTDEYFKELIRVSKNKIIWGGNYFPYLWQFGSGFIFWFKGNPVQNFADGELAWTSFKKPAKQFNFRYYGNLQGNTTADNKIHPTQKPLELYSWLLKNYAKEGDKILDTHLGSGSAAISAHREGFDFTGIEIDKDYFEASVKRFKRETIQLTLI